MKIINIDLRLIEKNGVVASCWIQFDTGIAFKSLILTSRRDGSEYLQLPTERYTDRNGQVQSRKIVTLSESLYHEVAQRCLQKLSEVRQNRNRSIGGSVANNNVSRPSTDTNNQSVENREQPVQQVQQQPQQQNKEEKSNTNNENNDGVFDINLDFLEQDIEDLLNS